MRHVVFVCTGNTCRSPMAEGIFKKLLAERGITDVEASSAGIFAMTGDAATENAVRAAERFGADLSDHRARRLTEYLLDEADLFVCMTREHAATLGLYVPPEKLTVLGDGIPDPYGGDLETYMICANRIKTALEAQWTQLVGEAAE
ncbi:MAG: low molecular weight protein arginine phosphatase [Clostridia bacterium]|nr:low molecular weight protein arginine phosphatase [Clostridia bacterium]